MEDLLQWSMEACQAHDINIADPKIAAVIKERCFKVENTWKGTEGTFLSEKDDPLFLAIKHASTVNATSHEEISAIFSEIHLDKLLSLLDHDCHANNCFEKRRQEQSRQQLHNIQPFAA